jgi:hypothetical protein
MKLRLLPVFALALSAPLGAQVNSAILHLPETNSDLRVTCVGKTIHVQTPGHDYSLRSNSDIVRLSKSDTTGLHPGDPIHGLTLDPSHLYFVGHYTQNNHPHSLLFFFGDSALNGFPMFVIGFHENGVPYTVLELPEFNMERFDGSEGTPKIIGRKTLPQAMSSPTPNDSTAPYGTTYDPFSVFVITIGAQATYSTTLSRSYNEQQYIWAGPHTREDYAVLYRVPGHPKPFGVPAEKFSRYIPPR